MTILCSSGLSFETGRSEALVGFYVVQNPVAAFKPDRLVFSVFAFVTGRAHSRGKGVEQRNQLLGFNEAAGVQIPFVVSASNPRICADR
jgi:hypothetical protein